MKVIIDVNVETSQMLVHFPDRILRFAIAPVIKGIERILSYKNGFISFEAPGIEGNNFIDLREICAWVGYQPDFSNILLEVA